VFRFLLRRLGQTLVVLAMVSLIVFFLIRLIPGDPVMTMLGNEYTDQAYRELRGKLGLDRPIPVQYAMWLRDLAR
jgi:peptide/nickel transport system permease protein